MVECMAAMDFLVLRHLMLKDLVDQGNKGAFERRKVSGRRECNLLSIYTS